ncbi:MAG TPA: 3-isopropylmalate dehydrogenase [Gaiella sp.]|nr:3-isopropylmalate dehydrogenase [Gaiella sp.]
MTVVAVLPGDGIGPEVAAEAIRVLDALGVDHAEHPFGGGAILAQGTPLPDETLAACRESDAVLLAAVGLPELEGRPVRPEQGLLGLRKELGVYANLRPARAEGIDLVVVRELVGGLYFGAKGTRDDGTWFDTCEYTRPEVERIARTAFALARERGGRVTSVDKVNVMHTSRLWRDVVTELGSTEYADVPLDHALVDSFAMTVVNAPETIDVVLTENTFGDILSDVAAAVTGGLGLAASASLGDDGPGLFEPVHGSAPQIAGQGVANPAAMLRSTALLLRHGLGREEEAVALEGAVDAALVEAPTPDLGGSARTRDLGDAVLRRLAA